ncbi:menaquinol-cytochrome c reductase cytochrome b/c subunit [Alicyclobacillus sp. SO9]|uniref:menaquinol-cytochrome c reductase cytochrome b/c subunit n=1 Tax=Alicyclobacillus sp. SO9 TaxID=2665646 RepID=UPI0018E8F7B1|nr:menaquinol-cytochrome c reductase cytochrome b/c subunit [Alicyclobacillus sp. SO9]QQE76790.1 c-type cytochrome [Alicyclobacillus sp. SO9]
MAGGERIPGTPRYRHNLKANSGYEPFIPNFLLKEWIAGSVFLLGFVLWVIFNHVTLGAKANPDDTSFIPVPDWYFLFIYQFLKYYPGSGLIFGLPGGFFGGVLVPGIGALLLMFVPWLDTRKERHPFRRPLATASMVLVVFLTIWLTNEAWVQHRGELGKSTTMTLFASKSSSGSTVTTLPKVQKIPASQIHFTDTSMPGYKLFQKTCASCHGNKGEGAFGPPIYAIGKYWNAKQLTNFVENPKGGMPKNGNLQSTAQVQQVVDWLVKQKTSGK